MNPLHPEKEVFQLDWDLPMVASLSPEAYHLIVAADGMHSKLRTRYAGNFFGRALSSPISDEERSQWDAQENLEANVM